MSASNTVATEDDEACIRDKALEVCGLAFTNDNVAARVNAFGPLAFCTYLQLPTVPKGQG